MAKQTRIPELVVGKIYIDGGDKDKVYTIGSDAEGALRIGDSKSNMVATIDQKTGKIVANSFAGDGSALAGISAEGLADLQTARLLTLSADKLFFNYDADGVAKVTNPAQTITLTAKTQNIENPTFNWYSNEFAPVASGDNGELLVIDLNQMGDNEFITVTVEVDNESLSESTTIFRLQEGRTGRDAVTVAMVNPTVTYQATLVDGDTPDIPEDDADFMAAGEANITVRYGATKLTPVTGTPGDNEFTVTVASSEYVSIPTDPSYIAPDTANKKMDIGAPANVIAQVGTITFDVTAQVDGETYSFTQIQNFNLNVPGQVGATGEGAKFVKLTSDDYQFAYNSDGLQADPPFVTLTADAQNHGDAIYYRWFVDDVPWEPGTTGTAISPTPTQHLYTTTNSIRLNAASSHSAYGFKKIVRVETQTTDDGDPIASDSVSVIATKDGSNAIQIAADNLTHGFPANPDGTIDSDDYDDGAITFQVYHGNTNMTPNMTVVGSLKDEIQGTSIGSSPTQSSINSIVASLQNGEFAVLADATTATVDGADVNTIDPFGSPPQNITDVTGDEGLKFFPNSMQTSLRRAAINYTFYLRTADGQLAASTVRTQSFVKGRDGAAGADGQDGANGVPGSDGKPGTDASAVKLTLNDYQVGFDENGNNPQTFAGDATVTAEVNTQGLRAHHTLFRIYIDDVAQAPLKPIGAPWEAYNWQMSKSGRGIHKFDFKNNTYSGEWSARKKVIKVEVAEIDFTAKGGVYEISSKDINGDPQDVANLTVRAEDSETIIATKEGSNAVEVFANNLSHQFIEGTSGNIDYSGGGIRFGVYIGNDELDAWDGQGLFSDNGGDGSFRAYPKSFNNITPSTSRQISDSGKSITYDPPSAITDSAASITWGIQIKDSTGTERPERELVQTFTKARDGSDSKLIRIDASSRVFSFESAYDYQADPSEIIFSVPSQNLAPGEEIGVDDIVFLDKDGADVSSLVKNYVNPPVNNTTQTTEEQITAQLAQGNTFTMRFAQFQPLAKMDSGLYYPVGAYQDPDGNTIEDVVPVLQDLKKTAFPLTVRVHKTGLAGAVPSIMDEVRLLSLEGGSSAISIDAPNAMHLFDASADMEVDNSQESRDAAGTDIDVYIGTTLLEYDSDATDSSTLEPGKYRFGDFVYGTKTGAGSGGNMLTLAVRSDHTGIEVTNISTEYTKQTVTLPVQVKRTDGMEETKNLILSYSKVKEGRDGENLKDRNFDFSQGNTGWSLDNTADKGPDLPLTHMKVTTDDKATFGGSVGKFMGAEFEDGDNPIRTRPIWISEALPVGGTPGAAEDDDIDEGVWVIKFRARAPDSSVAGNHSGSPLRVWLLIKPFAADGTAYSGDYDSDQALYFNSLPELTTGYTTDKTFFNGAIKAASGEAATKSFSQLSVPLMKTHYTTYVARITPADIRELMSNASSFKIGFMYQDSDMTSYIDGERIGLHVDAFQAEKFPYASLVRLDPSSYSRIALTEASAAENAANNSELSDRFGHLVDETSDADPEVLFNGKLNIVSPTDSYPEGVILISKNTSGSPARDTSSGLMRYTGYWSLQNAKGTGNKAHQRGLAFQAVKIPSVDDTMNIDVTYSRNEGSDGTHPSVYVYFHDSELVGEKKYVLSSTPEFKYSNTATGDNADAVSVSNNPNIYHGTSLTKLGDISNPITETITINFDDEWNGNNGTGSPKWASIIIYGAAGDNEADLYLERVTLFWNKRVLASTANNAAATIESRFENGRLLEGHATNNRKRTAENFAANAQEGDVVVNPGDGSSLPVPYLYGEKTLSFAVAGSSFSGNVIKTGAGVLWDDGTGATEHTIDDDHKGSSYEFIDTLITPPITYVDGDSTLENTSIYLCAYNDIGGFQNETTHYGIVFHPGMNSFIDLHSDDADGEENAGNGNLSDATNPRVRFVGGSDHKRFRRYKCNETSARKYWQSICALTRGETPENDEDLWMEALDDDNDVLSYTISSKLGSTTYKSRVRVYNKGGTDVPALTNSQNRSSAKSFYTHFNVGTPYQDLDKMQLKQEKDGGSGLSANGDEYVVHEWYFGRALTYNGYAMTFRKTMVRGPETANVKINLSWIGLLPTTVGAGGHAYYTKDSSTLQTGGLSDINKQILNSYNWDQLEVEVWIRKYISSAQAWDTGGNNDGWYKMTTIKNSSSGQEVSVALNDDTSNGPASGQKFQVSLRFTGRPGPLMNVVLKQINVEGAWHEDKDQDLETKVYEVAADSNTNFSTFTGKHRCVVEGEVPDVGMLVSSTGKYDNVNYQNEDEDEPDRRFKVNPQEAVPVVVKTSIEKDKKVLGVLCREDTKSRNNSYFKSDSALLAKNNIPRYDINSLGEGGIWVSNIAGDLENGDYICSSNIPGYGMKQDDDILRNYTVAKITQDCTFELKSRDYDCKEVEHDGIVYKVAFVGCTYHCG